MSRDNNPKSGVPDLGKEFSVNKGERYRDIANSVGETASAELSTVRDHEKAMEQHQLRWIRERDKLAHMSDLYPDFDLGSRAHRNLLEAYEERRTQWNRQADQIDNSYQVKRDEIRKTGKTVSNEFAVPRGPPHHLRDTLEHTAKPSGPSTGASEVPASSDQSQVRKGADDFPSAAPSKDVERSR